MRRRHVGIAIFGLVLSSGAWMTSVAPGYSVLDRAGEPLRERFNADAGKVRVLMLVAPT